MPDDPHDPMAWRHAESAQIDPDERRPIPVPIVWALVGIALGVGLVLVWKWLSG